MVTTEIDLNHSSTKRAIFSRSICERIDMVAPPVERAHMVGEIIAELEANPPDANERPGRSVSASAVGDECARRVQFGIWPTFQPDKPQPKQAPIDDKLRIIFARGHATEPLVAAWMRAAGFDLVTHKRDEAGEEKQHGFAVADGQIKGFADGIIRGQSVPMVTPLMWEHKTVSAKNHRAVAKHGVLKQYPKYDTQVQLLMAYLELPATLVSFLCAETASGSTTGDLYFELVHFDPARAQAVSDHAVHILQATRAGELLPRVRADGDGFPCKWCRFREECWG